MRPTKESKAEKFRRLAEARVNKILALIRLLGNLSGTNVYSYTREQVEQIFSVLQLELLKAKLRFLNPTGTGKKRFSLGPPDDPSEENEADGVQAFAIPLPDGTYLRAVGYTNDDYPSVNIFWDNSSDTPTEILCFAEFNPDKSEDERVCIGAYRSDQEDTIYYAPYNGRKE